MSFEKRYMQSDITQKQFMLTAETQEKGITLDQLMAKTREWSAQGRRRTSLTAI